METSRAAGRIPGFDLARGCAVIGMVIVNFAVVLSPRTAEPGWLRALVHLLEGRAAATFVVLAGVGMTLMARRRSDTAAALRSVRRELLRRAAVLFALGLAFTVIWPPDILHFYGLYIALGVAALAAPGRVLWVLAALLVLSFDVLLGVLDYETGWDFETLTYTDLWTPAGFPRHLLFNGFHPVLPWGAFVLVGMWLGRRDVDDPAGRRRLLGAGAAVAAAAHGLSALSIARLTSSLAGPDREALAAVLGTEMIPPGPFYMLAAGGTATAFLMLCVEVALVVPARWLRPLTATGQLALTLYVAHVVLGFGTLEALGRLESQSLGFAVSAALVFSAFAVAAAHLWRRRFTRGPLEGLMRRLSQRPSDLAEGRPGPGPSAGASRLPACAPRSSRARAFFRSGR